MVLSSLKVNDPFLVEQCAFFGGHVYYWGYSDNVSGWVDAMDIAFCKNKAEWLGMWQNDTAGTDFIVVTTDYFHLSKSHYSPATSDLLLTMGTTLKLVPEKDLPTSIWGRGTWNNYAVYVPTRDADGNCVKQIALIAQNKDVNVGYLPMTSENAVNLSFEYLGDTYGWGGMLNSQDCSGYIRDVYSCFGLNLPRNTTWQIANPVKKYNLSGLSSEAKKEIIKNLPAGSTLFFPGHEMAYLGHVKDKYYVISSVSSVMNPKKDGVRQRARCVAINTLDIKRANGNTWLESLTCATIPFAGDGNVLYEKNFVGKGFEKKLDTTELSKASANGKKLAVKWIASDEASAIEGYQIQYASGSDFSSAKTIKIKNKAKSSYTITGLKKGSTVKVRIRNYLTIDGKKYYSKWSKAKTIKI